MYCGNACPIAHIVCTHPDGDHASGLRTVIKHRRVQNLWIHRPWLYAEAIASLFRSANWTSGGLDRALRSQYPLIEELESLALISGTAINAPFEGATIGPFTVLSPSTWAYAHLLPQFRRTPDSNVDAIKAANMWLGEPGQIATLFAAAGAKVANWLPEWWDFELLSEFAATSAENETSVVLHGDFGTTSVLLTADAGVNALMWAHKFAVAQGIDLTRTALVQVPHHGSRRNVTPTVLDLIVGPKLPSGSTTKKIAIVSAPKDDEVHPRRVVANAFLRRGAPVYATQGRPVRWYRGMEVRPHYTSMAPLPFFGAVEAET